MKKKRNPFLQKRLLKEEEEEERETFCSIRWLHNLFCYRVDFIYIYIYIYCLSVLLFAIRHVALAVRKR